MFVLKSIITLIYNGCAYDKCTCVFNSFSDAEHESWLKSCPLRLVFEKKKHGFLLL